jgi:hypothetical protein
LAHRRTVATATPDDSGCGRQPAPAINAVIGAATIRAALEGLDVVGVRDGFEWLMQCDTEHVMLTAPHCSISDRTICTVLYSRLEPPLHRVANRRIERAVLFRHCGAEVLLSVDKKNKYRGRDSQVLSGQLWSISIESVSGMR